MKFPKIESNLLRLLFHIVSDWLLQEASCCKMFIPSGARRLSQRLGHLTNLTAQILEADLILAGSGLQCLRLQHLDHSGCIWDMVVFLAASGCAIFGWRAFLSSPCLATTGYLILKRFLKNNWYLRLLLSSTLVCRPDIIVSECLACQNTPGLICFLIALKHAKSDGNLLYYHML